MGKESGSWRKHGGTPTSILGGRVRRSAGNLQEVVTRATCRRSRIWVENRRRAGTSWLLDRWHGRLWGIVGGQHGPASARFLFGVVGPMMNPAQR
jgi:hypothetical protein